MIVIWTIIEHLITSSIISIYFRGIRKRADGQISARGENRFYIDGENRIRNNIQA